MTLHICDPSEPLHIFVQQFQALRKDLEAAKLQECTFRPRLCTRTRKAAAQSCNCDAPGPKRLPLHERLAQLEMLQRWGCCAVGLALAVLGGEEAQGLCSSCTAWSCMGAWWFRVQGPGSRD